jgi:hypothetical protein
MKTEQEEQQEFNRLLELAFLRKERKYHKFNLQREERQIKRLLEPKSDIKFQRKKQLSFPYIEFTPAEQILAKRKQKRKQIIKKIIIAIILISIALLFFAKFYL